ncbi:MAG TPA: Fe-S protein assembly co-chaperone HscB [Casimicrobiaceae bacterium]|nr:Fe-S protein assembly co-chaperone HscB [Casimicrobiaceae bacterium]
MAALFAGGTQNLMIDFSRNYFDLFQLPQRFGCDPISLENAYRRLQTEVHPDRFASGSEQEKRLALQSSARVNEAYRALKDPVSRAQYLLSLNGIDALSETDTQLPLEFLERQLERRETAAEAVDNEDSQGIADVATEVRDEADDLVHALVDALDGEHAYSDARMRVRELKFLSKLADDLDAMQGALDDQG